MDVRGSDHVRQAHTVGSVWLQGGDVVVISIYLVGDREGGLCWQRQREREREKEREREREREREIEREIETRMLTVQNPAS
jgi:hypothetical protein